MSPLAGFALSQNHWKVRFSRSAIMGGTGCTSLMAVAVACFGFAGSFSAIAIGAAVASRTPRARERHLVVLACMNADPWACEASANKVGTSFAGGLPCEGAQAIRACACKRLRRPGK